MPPASFSSDVATGVTFGNYVVGELIGRGAMASVYRAEHVMLNKAVALKLMDRSLLDSPGARERFLREGRVVASITHPNVVNITDVGVHEGTPYLVMELLLGEDLHSHLSRNAPLDDRAATRLALPLIAALSAAHDAGVVHRDVKPSNIFLERGSNGELTPKVLDFGISKLLERTGIDLVATSPNQLIGSPLYLAPEALRGPGHLGPASDQYSLGVVLYECVTGRTPFQGDTLMALLGALARGAHPLPSAIRPDIAPALERVIERAMALDPKERFPNLREMGAALLGLAAERTQVVWANSFKPQVPEVSSAAAAPEQSLAHRPPSGRLVLGGPASTPLPPLRQPPWQRLKSKWIAAGLLAVVGAAALISFARWQPAPKGTPVTAPRAASASAPGAEQSAAVAAPGTSSSSAERAPEVAMVPGPLPVAEEESTPAPVSSAAESKVTRAHALQPARRKPARERRSRSRRAAAAEAAPTESAGETSETARASRNDAAQRAGAEREAPAAGEDELRRRGANQSPYLD